MAAESASETASTERAAAMCDVSYPLNPFPPFQNTNALLVCVLGFSAAQAYLKYSKKEVCNHADNLHHPDRAFDARSAVHAGAAVPEGAPEMGAPQKIPLRAPRLP